MMDDAELATRKRLLQAQSAVLRQTWLAQVDEQLGPPLAWVDRARSVAMWLGQRPWVLVAAGAAVVVWRPTGVLRWAKRGLWAWQMWQQLKSTPVSRLPKG